MSWALDNLGESRRRAIFEGLIQLLGGRLDPDKHAGRDELWACCPFHGDENSSLSYNLAKDAWRCFGCPAKGDLITLYGEVHKITDNKEAFKAFVAEYGEGGEGGQNRNLAKSESSGERARKPDPVIPEAEWQRLPALPEVWVRRLESKRAWTPETIAALDLRLWTSPRGEQRVAIPVRDGQGRLLNVRLYRPGAPAGEKIKSFWTGEGPDRITYGTVRLWPPPSCWRGGEPLWLCEGEPDTICALSLGLNACTQTGGAGSWKPAFNDAFAGRQVVICYDADQPGRDGAAKVAQALARRVASVRIIAWPDFMAKGQDLTDFIVKHDRTRADLEALAAAAPVYAQAETPPKDGGEAEPSPSGPGRFWAHGEDGRSSFRPARLAAEMLKELDLVTDRETKRPYRWTGQYFRPVEDEDLQRLALTKLGGLATTARAKDAVAQVRANSFLPEGLGMNPRDRLLCLRNGVFNLMAQTRAESITPHDRDLRQTFQFPWEFDPRTPQACPRWKEFLRDVVGNDLVVAELQEFFGYCFWPDCRFEMALVLVGPGGAGKGTILNVLQLLVGEENVSNVSMAGLDNEFHRATLLDKALNVFSETQPKLLASEYIKAIVSGDRIDASFKHQTPFQFRPRCKLAFSANRFPRVSDYSDAFYRRLMIIEFPQAVAAQERDTTLLGQLVEELPGIFAWSLVGLYRLLKRGRFQRSAPTQEAVDRYRKDNNPVMGFCEECITTAPAGFDGEAAVAKDRVFSAYQGYCKRGGYSAMSKERFFIELKAVSPPYTERKSTTAGKRVRFLVGISLTPDALDQEEAS